MLIQQGKYGIWNVGRDDQLMSMYEIAKLACKLTDAPTDLIKVVDVPGPRTVAKNLSMAKIRTIGWEPRVDVEEGMRRTLSWVEKLPGP
jgi:nucleoside-diphosphate-sugar epimerase